ncbi:MAG: hypothetical protein DRQ35_03220 [Gammaproteobacteria bacterium]|nr:MAG: hypothetical protein DRQ35_03220 [Gammaproteobacteria bacterium]
MILKTPIERYPILLEEVIVQKNVFIFKALHNLRALHSFVKKSGRKILQNNSNQGFTIAVELLFVFHAQIFHKDYAQQEYSGS